MTETSLHTARLVAIEVTRAAVDAADPAGTGVEAGAASVLATATRKVSIATAFGSTGWRGDLWIAGRNALCLPLADPSVPVHGFVSDNASAALLVARLLTSSVGRFPLGAATGPIDIGALDHVLTGGPPHSLAWFAAVGVGGVETSPHPQIAIASDGTGLLIGSPPSVTEPFTLAPASAASAWADVQVIVAGGQTGDAA